MKKTLCIFMFLFLTCLCVSALATDSGSCGESVTWTLDENGVLTISGTGAMNFWDGEGSGFGWDKDKIRIVIIEDGVTAIGSCSFYGCPNLESIFIPASVTSFGEGGDTHYEVAGNCPKLKEFIVATSNQTYCSKDGVLFSKDMKTLYRCPEGKSGRYAIPEGVRHIYDKLGDTSYGLAAFDRCKQLTEVAIPEGVKYLGWGLFTGCSGLKNLQFPVSLTCIYNNCFYDCGNIEKIYYSGTKKQWKEVTIYGGNEDLLKAKVYYRDEEPGSVIVSGGKYELNAKKTAAVFTGPENKNAKSLTIQKKVRIDGSDYHVTEIASDACSGMKKLSDLSIGIYVEKIGTNAFGGCWNLKKVKVLTAKLKKKNIGAGCFSEIYEKVVFSVPKKMLNQYKKWFIKIGEAPETSMFVK